MAEQTDTKREHAISHCITRMLALAKANPLSVRLFLTDGSLLFPLAGSQNEISRYSSDEISGNESNEVTSMTESERQADFNRQKEEMKIKRRKKKRTSSSMQSSTFKGTKRPPRGKCAVPPAISRCRPAKFTAVAKIFHQKRESIFVRYAHSFCLSSRRRRRR